ncbi:hypothetical protein [Micromonospora globbae]|uniref:Nuclear transport factor 2 family protein n=1 Tax=Micromonospora globbae TaxID=1894969 RepID=A0A420F643_9ACTN|nr:hypothetical protein [Micromonospora globbae]RKF28398.1 hypothetical protein D7I43_05090 [Micromonospora globbae]
MGVTYRRLAGVAAALAVLPPALAGCGLVGDAEEPAKPDQAPAEEASAKSRERVQAYLDAMVAKDVAAGRSQLCAPLHEAFDGAATGPNGDFADHFEVSQAAITDIRPGPRGQEVDVSVSVAAGTRKATRSLVFTVTRDGADWCIAGEAPGDPSAAATPTPTPAS